MLNNIIYNEKHLVILSMENKHLKKYFDYCFKNVILVDCISDMDKIKTFINNNNFSQLIFVDYEYEYIEILNSLRKKHTIKFIFTRSLGAFCESYIYSKFNKILELKEQYNIESIGFIDENLYEVFNGKSIKCYPIFLDIPYSYSEHLSNYNKFIGILNDEKDPKHSFYNELSATKFNKYTVKLKNINKTTKSFLKLFNITYKKVSTKEELYSNNVVNLNINFTSNFDINFIESMDKNVPCILGNNSILKENNYLKSMLVVKSDDSIDEISDKIKLVLKNRNKIIEEYKKFRKLYIKKSEKSIETFLGYKISKDTLNDYEKILSIIVPVYNTESYLDKSLKSIFNAIPFWMKKNIEVLIINDGSTDNSENVIDKYIKKYPKSIRYIKQKNKGLGNVRNVGLKNARGKYIASIDSDDTINRKFFKSAIKYMHDNIDIIVYDWLSVTDTSKFITGAVEWIFNDINKYEGLLYTTIMPSSCNKIIKKKLYDDLNIKFIEDKYEDLSTNPFVMLSAKTIKYINKPYYEYYIRSNSIMRSSAGYSMIDVINMVEKRINKYKDIVNVDIEKFKYYTYSWRIEEFILNQLYDIEEDKISQFVDYIYTNLYDIISVIFNNKYYLDMVNKLDENTKQYILERNKAFVKKDLEKFIKRIKSKKDIYKLNAPIIYFGKQ